jgi:hypothetical protein
MATVSRVTYFAAPERSSLSTMERQRLTLSHDPVISALLESFPEPASILNEQRQIVCANRKLAQLVGRPEPSLVGMRMGEAMGCVHGREQPAGCGTTPACAVCGAAAAIAATQTRGEETSEECRLTTKGASGHEALDLRVWTTPFPFEGEQFAVFAVRDTSDEQRRRVLERMFYHDVLNAAGGLRDVLRLWPEMDGPAAMALSTRIAPLAAQVVEEIESQRDLAAAERGELSVSFEAVDIADLLDQIGTLYRHHSAADGKDLVVVSAGETPRVETDAVALRRVLGNLVKNALEASSAGERVTIRFTPAPRPRFSVHNESVMPEAVRLQVFQRSFSTKGGHGRGVGTYSARLLAERYLGGRLSFSSVEGQGTTFVLDLPPASG